MPKRSKNSPAGKSVAAVLLLTVVGVGGLAAYVGLNPKAAHVTSSTPPAAPDVSVRTQPDAERQPQAPAAGLTLLVPSVVENDVKLGKEADQPPSGVAPEVSLINQTLGALQVDGARALGIEVKERVAMVSFNPGIEKGYGTIEEGHLIKALRMALGQFKDIDKFQLLVEGKVVDSLGNIDLTTPVPVLRPGQADPPDTGN